MSSQPFNKRAADNRPNKVGYIVLLATAFLFHTSLLVSWRTGLWNRYTFDTTATHGRKGWDFYALYQAGHNALNGISIYESDNDKIKPVVTVYTPYRYLPLPALTLGILVNLLPPSAALWGWAILLELLLLQNCWRSWRLRKTWQQGVVLVAMWLCFTPYYLELYLGQFTLVQASLIFVLMTWSLTANSGGRLDIIWLATLLWKQMTALFLPLWVIWRRWQGLLLISLGVAVFTLPYFLAFPDSWPAFSTNMRLEPGSQLGNLGGMQLVYALTTALFPGLPANNLRFVLVCWAVLIVAISLLASLKSKGQPRQLGLCLWTMVFLLVYQDVWEHHYVLLLPVLVMLYREHPSTLLLVLYGLTAIWTPYRLVDPGGLAAYDMSMRWLPLQPNWLNVLYHACKALPTLTLWVYTLAKLVPQSGPPARLRA